jgi:hypothetical protein
MNKTNGSKNIDSKNRNSKSTLFSKGRNQISKCRVCGNPCHSSIDGNDGISLCRGCYDLAGWENTHEDDGHDRSPVEGCPFCKGK